MRKILAACLPAVPLSARFLSTDHEQRHRNQNGEGWPF